MRSILLALCCVIAVTQTASASDDLITMRISPQGLQIATTDQEVKAMRNAGISEGSMLIVCREMEVTRNASKLRVRCADVHFVTDVYARGTAKFAEFDLTAGTAVLTGDSSSKVELVIETAEADSRMLAERLEIPFALLLPSRAKSDGSQPDSQSKQSR
ncbi:MAG: hypothetical protein MPJ50_10285 [Pirellulales bacterium]|nr:hypothetical protein [Pirellulales bacterium]